jgi:GNAT superfamily N-acetyltransferase
VIATVFARLFQLAIDLALSIVRGILSTPSRAVEQAVKPIDVRSAQADEVIDVRHAVLRQGRPRDTAVFDGDMSPSTRHWVAERSGLVIGVVTVIQSEQPEPCDSPRPRWQLRGMANLPEYRGQGLGVALLHATHADVGEPMWCNARQGVAGFYAKHGWTAAGEPFDVPLIGPHVRMVWRG